MTSKPLRVAFLGCGFITQVHSRNLKALRRDVECAYASRDGAKAAALCRRYDRAGMFRNGYTFRVLGLGR